MDLFEEELLKPKKRTKAKIKTTTIFNKSVLLSKPQKLLRVIKTYRPLFNTIFPSYQQLSALSVDIPPPLAKRCLLLAHHRLHLA